MPFVAWRVCLSGKHSPGGKHNTIVTVAQLVRWERGAEFSWIF